MLLCQISHRLWRTCKCRYGSMYAQVRSILFVDTRWKVTKLLPRSIIVIDKKGYIKVLDVSEKICTSMCIYIPPI